MATPFISPENMEKAIRAAIQERTAEACEPIIKQAMADIEREMRLKVAKIAINVASRYDIQRLGDNIMVSVRMTPDDLKRL